MDTQKHKQYVIERVLERGSWNDLKELASYYTVTVIKEAIKKARWLDAKTMYFVSAYFDIPLDDLRCYKQRLLSPLPWV